MRKILFLFFQAVSALLFSYHMTAQTPEFKVPDFAYPKTVESDAEAMLNKVGNRTDEAAGVIRLRGILELCAAQTQIDRASMFGQPALIAAQAAKATGASKAMLVTLEAAKYAQIYTSSRWKYDKVDAPLEPYPADISEWSGLQFRTRIAALYEEALALASKTGTTPLSTFSSSLEYSKEALEYIPTVTDFVRYRAYKSFTDIGDSAMARKIANQALETSAPGSAPYFYWYAEVYRNDSKEIKAAYQKYIDTEAARYLLQKIVDNGYYGYGIEFASEDTDNANAETSGIVLRNEHIEAIRASLRQFPDWYGNNSLKNALARLTQPTITYKAPSMVALGDDIVVECEYSFAKNIEASLYLIPANAPVPSPESLVNKPKAASAKYEATATDGTATMTLKVSEPGTYVLAMEINGTPGNGTAYRYMPQIIVTPLLGFSLTGCSDNVVVATDFATGKPLKNVTIKAINTSNRNGTSKKPQTLGQTGRDGYLISTVPASDYRTRYYTFTYGGVTYDFNGQVQMRYSDNKPETDQVKLTLMTDRAIYHPGDTVRWAIVATGMTAAPGARPEILSGRKFTIDFKDANYQLVDSVTVTTDDRGRAEGSFVTRKDALTGRYLFTNREGQSLWSSVMVSDFKLPTFEVKIDKIERDIPESGGVRISGSARTFTGMPVAGAKVSLSITGARWWRWFSPERELTTVDTTTGTDGVFTVDIPASAFKSDDHFVSFIAKAEVVSAAAETAEASRNFTIGKPYMLSMSHTASIADSSTPVKALFEALNADGDAANIEVRWELGTLDELSMTNVKIKDIVASGTAVTGRPVELDLSAIPAGRYSFRIAPADTTLANVAVGEEITLYNVSRNQVPDLGASIFVPQTTYKAEGRKAKILVGVPGDEKAYVFVAVRKGEKLQSFSTETLKPGFNHVSVAVADVDAPLQVVLSCVRNGKVTFVDVAVAQPAAANLKVVAESFRDKLTPGTTERWRFRLMDGNGESMCNASMIATMYNRALDKLLAGSWPSSISFSEYAYRLSVEAPYLSTRTGSIVDPLSNLDVVEIEWPQFMFFSPWNLFNSQMKMVYASTAQRSVTGAVGGLNSVVVKEQVVDGVNDLAASSGAVIENEVAEEESADADAGAGSEEKFDYRVSELLQVFWKPLLVADAEGNIDLVFDMPNAIGSWAFNAFAWTPDVKSAAYAAECMSSKPVMVQPNLPRFLRQGDKARVLATVYNNSGESASVTTVVELFDIASGEVKSTVSSTDSIADGGSTMVGIDIDVPTDASAIGYRVRSSIGSFADGEQSAIPVLASSATVIESTEFYLNPSEKEPFTLTIPAADNASVTLQYCQNPIWTIVKAMRGLSEPGNTSNSIAGSLFSALAGKYITSSNPAIAEAIATWKANPSEEALVSMLAKNEELKKLMLDQTPWVQASKNQTARMSSLSDLLDAERTESTIVKCVADLGKLQNSDGGFAWGPWNNTSSVWSTEVVLTTMGLANSMGMLPADDNLHGMLERAFNYLQREAAKPKRPSTDSDLALIAALMPELKIQPGADKIIRATVAYMANNWRKFSTTDKAYAIIILKANGRSALAADVLASVRQHGVVRPGKGLCFPNVNDVRGYATIIQAYVAMDAPKSEIDAMRQWITVRAQAIDNLGAYNTDYVIAAVMLTGSDWTSVPVEESVSVNGSPVTIGKVESATGYFAQSLTTDGSKPLTISVRPNGVTPSYGSVVSIGRRPMAVIESKAGSDVSVEKRVLVNRNGEWVETNTFALGERVRVQLIIKAGRDLQYVSIDDERPATFEPVDQLPGYVYDGGLGFYRENCDAATRLFIGWLPKGTYHVTYDMTAAVVGAFQSGIATLQSQYAPEITAHSGAAAITVKAQ